MPICRSLLCLFVTIIIYHASYAQPINKWHCADEEIRRLQRGAHTGNIRLEYQKDILLREYIKNIIKRKSPPLSSNQVLTDGDIYNIPVIVHVVHPPGEPYGTGVNISYAQIRSQLEALNAAFAKSYPSYNNQSHPAYARDTRIRFCLARTAPQDQTWAEGPGGTEWGVLRYDDATGAYDHEITNASAGRLLKVTHPIPEGLSFTSYMNIWLVKTIEKGNSVMGYAPRPIIPGYPLDGIVMRADVFGDNSTGLNFPLNGFGLTQGKVLAHEVGHYLNLYHIFQDGCAGKNASGAATDACDLNGDRICDIEPSETQNVFCSSNLPNTCTANYDAGTTTFDMINNYMSYADDDCMNTFTEDQTERMWATLNIDRKSLWQPENLAATGVLGGEGCVPSYLNPKINTDNAVFCKGKPVIFSNPLQGNTATSRQWTFTGGDVTASDGNPVTVVFPAAGEYQVTHTVSDGFITASDTLRVSILDCKVDSSLLYMSQWYFGDYGSLDFSSGAPVPTKTALTHNTIHAESSYPEQNPPFIGGTVSLSDSMGNLLFYSNGVSVWNGNHQKISNGPIFGRSDINASSGFCYIPFPGRKDRYFLAGASGQVFINPEGVKFVEIDLATNTVSPFKEFAAPESASEFLTVVPHCNGTDYWIITHGWGSDSKFYTYLVDSSGINLNQSPVVSSGTHFAYNGAGNQLKANRAGDRLVLCTPHGLTNRAAAIYNFDARTGSITNERIVPDVPGYNNIQTGSAFSPNGEYFYLMRSSDLETNGMPYWLFQYRVSDLSYNIINAPGFYFASPFQPGPDNQIYITTQDHYVSRITNPDMWGKAQVDGLFINMRQGDERIFTSVSIPGFIDARKPTPTKPEFTIEAIDCNTYRFNALCFDQYTASWTFGDDSTIQTGHIATKDFSTPGKINVTLSLSSGEGVLGSTTKHVEVLPLLAEISGPANVCTNGNRPAQYFAPQLTGVEYKWTANGGNISGSANFANVEVAWNPAFQNGRLSLKVTQQGCTLQAEKEVRILAAPEAVLSSVDSVCINDSAVVLTASPQGGFFAGAGVVDNLFYPSLAGVGAHTVSYTRIGEGVCAAHAEKVIKVGYCNVDIASDLNCEDVLNTIVIAPNPVTNDLQLKSPYNFRYAQVYNILGQRVAGGPLTSNRLPLPVLPAGIYIAVVYCKEYSAYRALRWMKL